LLFDLLNGSQRFGYNSFQQSGNRIQAGRDDGAARIEAKLAAGFAR